MHEAEEQLACNVIRKVPDHFDVALGEKNPRVTIDRIAMAKFESRIVKFFAQKIRQSRIFLQRQQTRTALEDLAGDRAKPRPNLQNKIVRNNLGLLDNPTRQVLIVQEILSQFFRRSHAGAVERCANLRKIHSLISRKAGKRACCSQKAVNKMWRGPRVCTQVIHRLESTPPMS